MTQLMAQIQSLDLTENMMNLLKLWSIVLNLNLWGANSETHQIRILLDTVLLDTVLYWIQYYFGYSGTILDTVPESCSSRVGYCLNMDKVSTVAWILFFFLNYYIFLYIYFFINYLREGCLNILLSISILIKKKLLK